MKYYIAFLSTIRLENSLYENLFDVTIWHLIYLLNVLAYLRPTNPNQLKIKQLLITNLAMRGMRPAKNPKARSSFVPRQIRSRRDAEEYEFDDEDYEALEDCDGTEEGAVAELCKQPRVSSDI